MNISGKYIDKNNNNIMNNFKYFSSFITKSLMYSIICFLIIICLLFIIYFIDLFYNVKSKNNKNPLFNAYVIVSPSMVPTIMINDAVVVKRKKAYKLNVGDIITFSSIDPSYTGLTVTHRIVGKQTLRNGNYVFRTKGDNNLVEDSSLVNEDNIYGKVFFKIPKLGFIRSFLLNSYGFMFGILLPCILILIFSTFKFIFKCRKNDNIEVI